MSDANVAKPEKGSQKMVITGTIILPPGDYFTTSERANAARDIVRSAQQEIANKFPGFMFKTDVTPWREGGGGRKSKATLEAEAKAKAEAEAAAAAAAGGAANGEDHSEASSADAAAASVGEQAATTRVARQAAR